MPNTPNNGIKKPAPLTLILLCLFLIVFQVNSGCSGGGGEGGSDSNADSTIGTDSTSDDEGDDGSSDATSDTGGSGGDTTGTAGITTGSGAFIVSDIGGNTSEAGNAATFTVRLAQEPTADVDISLYSSNENEGWADPTDLTFTPTNWSSAQTVLVRGVDDYVDDGDITYYIILNPAVSTDPSYDGEDPADVEVVNTDNDSLGVERGNLSGSTTEWGKQATFTLRLDSAPTDDVTIPIESSDTTEGTVEPEFMTFTPENWNSLRTVTITGQDDGLIDGNIQYSILLGPAESNDSSYDGFSISSVNLYNYDDEDNPGFSIQVNDGTTWEWGDTGQISVKLLSSPESAVTIGVSSSNTNEGTVSPDSLVFDSSNWNIFQSIEITGEDDSDQDGNTTFDIVLSAASCDGACVYDGLDPNDQSITNIDDDTPGFCLSIGAGNTTESGGTKSFSLSLTSQPSQEVTIPISTSDSTEGEAGVSNLVFNPINWYTAQSVTITGVDDDDRDGNISYTIYLGAAVTTDGSYDGLNPDDIPATNTDNDIVDYVRSGVSGQPSEGGGSATFTMKLDTVPYDTVTFPLGSSDESEGSIDPTELVFTTTNWDDPQTVTVSGVDDTIIDGNITFTLEIGAAVSRGDSDYNGLNPDDINFTNIDNDNVGITVSTISGNTTEAGGSASFTIVLDAPPTDDVSIDVLSSNTDEGQVNPDVVIFTPSNWNSVQQILVTGQDDAIQDDDTEYTIVIYPAVSEDLRYHNMDVDDITVTNIDNDIPGFTATPHSLNVVEGNETTFTLKLNTQPIANVMVDIESSDTSEATVSPSSLTFTSEEWTTEQTVTVTGVEDNIMDGNQTFNITLSNVVTIDPEYTGMDPADLVITSEESYGGTNLVLHFPFSGNANDTSGAGNDGTPNQVTLTSDRLGSENSAYHFDGTAYISTNLDAQPSAMSKSTWMAWVKPDQTSDTYQTLMCIWDGYFERCLTINAGGTMLNVNWGAGNWSPIKLDMNLWQHIAVVYSPDSTVKLYKNGVEYDRGGVESTSATNNTFHVGVNPGTGANFFHGKMDDIRVYNKALTPTEVRSVYGYYTTDNLVGEFYFDSNMENTSSNWAQAYNYGATPVENRSGTADKAYSLDGTNDYIYTNIDVQKDLMPESSWVGWIKPTNILAKNQAIFCTHEGYFERCLKMDSGSTTATIYRGNGLWRPINLDLNMWQHIALVFASGNLYFYKNGAQYVTTADVTSYTHNPLHIGVDPYNMDQFFHGAIDDVRIFDKALSAAEVQSQFGYSISNNLAADFQFSGNVLDSSGSGARAYNYNATLTEDRHGNSNGAYLLDGTSSYIKTSVDVQPQRMPDSTWAAWIKPTGINPSAGQVILCTHEGLFERCLKMEANSATATIFRGNGSWRPFNLDINLWQHIVLVHSLGSGIKLYKNGVEYLDTHAEVDSYTLHPLAIGINPAATNQFFAGAIDELKIYNKALTAEEVKTLFGYTRTDNLVAQFDFTGNLNDSSNSGAQIYNYGATLVADRNGVAESAYQLDGTNDYLYTNLDVQPASMPDSSWSAWIKPTSIKSNDQVILCTHEGYFERCLKMLSGSTDAALFRGNGTWQPFSLDLNLWQHIAVVYSVGNPIRFYKNGVEYTSTGSEVDSPTVHTLQIGRNPSGNNLFFEGAVDEFRVYDKALTAAEVRTLYGHTISNNIVAHFPFSGNLDNSGDSGAQAYNYRADLTTDRFDAADEAYAFDGTSDYIYTNIDVQPGAMPETTWMGWVLPQSTGASQRLFCIEDGFFERCVTMDSNNKIVIMRGNGNWYTNVSLTPDTWQHIAVVYQSDDILFYKDGVSVSRGSEEELNSSGKTLVIGRDPGSANLYFKGKMDDIRIYNTNLSSETINTIIGN